MICYPKHTAEGKALVDAVGTFEATRDWMENDYTVRTPEAVVAKLMAPDYRGSVPPMLSQVILETEGTTSGDPNLKTVYQGYNTLDSRKYNYFAKTEGEAQGYGKNTRKVTVNTTGFLKRPLGPDSQEYIDNNQEFSKVSGKDFDILDNTPEGLQVQQEFFKYLEGKGYKGLDMVSGAPDNEYIITFFPEAITAPVINDKTPEVEKVQSPLSIFKKAVKYRNNVSALSKNMIAKRVKQYNKRYGTDHYIPYVQVGQADIWRVTEPITERWNGYDPNQLSMFYRPLTEQQAKEELLDSPRGADGYLNQLPFELDLEKINQNSRIETVKKLAQILSVKLGVQYQFITPEQAAELTKDTKNPYQAGDIAFFHPDGQIYFIGDNITSEVVFHEFSHPFLRALSSTNKELFNTLYETLEGTPEGQQIINDISGPEYSYLVPGSDLFKEEALVRALAKRASDISANVPSSRGLTGLINNILYHIKQMLRKLFKAPIKPENLDVNTTVDQLAEMLVNDEFDIDTTNLTDSDINAFIREQKEQIADLRKVSELSQPFVDQMFKATLANPVLALQNAYPELLRNDVQNEQLKQMRNNISKYTTDAKAKQAVTDEVKYLNSQSEQFISSLFILKDTLLNLGREIEDIKNTPPKSDQEAKNNAIRVQYIMEFAKYWQNMLSHWDSELSYRGLREDSPLRQLISQSEDHIDKNIKRHADPIFKQAWTVLLSQTLKPMQERYERVHAERIAELKAKPQTPTTAAAIKDVEEEFQRLLINPERISAMLNGWEDANQLNTWLEPWMYSSDLVVGGFAAFLKNNLNDVLSNTYERWGSFVNDITPLLEKAGYNPRKISDLSDRITFDDASGINVLPDGTVERKVVYTFLNPHKEYRYTLAKLKHDLAQADKLEDKTEYNKLREEEEDLKRWFWREYKDEFYEKDEIFNSPVGVKAKQARDDIFDQINTLESQIIDEADFIELSPQIDTLWKKYRQLYALKDLNDDYKTGEDLEIALLLDAHKQNSRDFYQYVPKIGLFEGKLAQYEQHLADSGLKITDQEFLDKRQQWIDQNTVIRVKPEFYLITGSLYAQLKKIYDEVKNPSADSVELARVYKEIRDTLSGYRDDDGQPIGTDMSPTTIGKVKELQLKAEALRKQINSGLSNSERTELSSLFEMMKNKIKLTDKQQDRFDELVTKGDSSGLDKYQKAAVAGIWQQLALVQGKEPTEYYIDVFNNYLSKADVKEIIDLNKVGYMDKDSADYLINLPVMKKIFKADPKFESWFKENHIHKEYFDSSTNKTKQKWERVAAWSVVRPLNERFMEHTTVLGLDNKKTQILGTPSRRYFRREVKPEFRTEEILGKTKDIKGRWLPKSRAQGAPDDRFVNEKYYDLQRKDPGTFKLLETIKEHYLKMQAGADSYAQLGYDTPRLRKKGLELYQTPGYAKQRISTVSAWWNNIQATFTRAKDDPDQGYNPHDEILLAQGDQFMEPDRRQPVSGIYNLDIKEVSQDILAGIAVYMSGVERQKVLKAISPLAKSLKQILNDPENHARDMKRVNKLNFNFQHVSRLPKAKGKYIRATSINNLMDRELYGQQYTGLFAENKSINAITNLMFKGASFSYLAVQLPSAVTNMLVQMTQNLIESAAGEYINPSDLAYGTIKGIKVNTEISMEIYKVGSHSLEVQKTELFDAIPGRTEQKLGTNLSRTLGRDAVTLSALYSPRKFLENEATLQGFYAMMNHEKVTQTLNGVSTEITYDNAWELDKEGKIKLKEGIDKSYAPTGAKFNEIRNRMEIIQYKMNGAYDHFGQPEAQRYLIYRMFSFLRRYITTMLTNRWGLTRHNPGMMDVQTGYYIESMKVFWKALKFGGRYFSMMTPSEKRAFRKLFAELGIITTMTLMYGLLFGWDPNDDDKYDKLRAKSGALPIVGVADSEYPFQWDGWMSNHMLLQLMKTQAQTQMWIPLPGMGLKDYTDMVSMNPVAVSPTIDLYAKIVDDMIMMLNGDDRAYYQKDVGPYQWQQQDEAKIWNHLGNIPGFRGVTVEPVQGIQKAQSMKVKR